jgi:hypothetical protein
MQSNQQVAIIPSPSRESRLRYVWVLAIAYATYIVFICLNTIIGSNIVFDNTMLYEITEWIYLGIELAAFFFVYAVSIYGVFQYGEKKALPYAYLYGGMTLARHLVLFILNWAFFGLRTRYVPFQLLMTFITIVLELLQYAIIYVIAMLFTRRFNRYIAVMRQGASRLRGVQIDRRKFAFPFRKIPLKNDPIRITSLVAAALVSVVRVVNRMIYDFSYGAPTDTIDLLWMIWGYTLDILIGVLGYWVMLYIIIRLSKNSQKKKTQNIEE